uniref:uncharacterized protein isoform X2 n=1 Tax=Myxine glutinosa TaxID=7769 RepID=UPI00358F7E5B
MIRAAKEVVNNKRKCRTVAKEYDIAHVTLRRYCLKLNHSTAGSEAGNTSEIHVGYRKNQQVFTDAEEKLVTEYLLKVANLYYGLCPKEVRKLAYDFAMKNGKRVPKSWTEDKMAGVDWFTGFLKRNANISLGTPDATSLSGAVGFSRHNVQTFFTNLEIFMNRHNFAPQDVWNIDEICCTPVPKPSQIIAGKGVKQVGATTSAEHGVVVTVCCGINALGNFIPPMFVFPQVNFNDRFVRDGPIGCIGAAHPSGCMTGTNFLKFMKHFVHHAHCTPEHPVLLLLDNHDSNASVQVLDFARNNGVLMLSFPPHCSRKLQPLDRTVYFPFKKFFNDCCGSWLMQNKGRTMTIYDIPGIVRRAFPMAMTQMNITAGFKVAGIYPFNRNVFGEEEFFLVTDRPNPSTMCSTADDGTISDQDFIVKVKVESEFVEHSSFQDKGPKHNGILPIAVEDIGEFCMQVYLQQ